MKESTWKQLAENKVPAWHQLIHDFSSADKKFWLQNEIRELFSAFYDSCDDKIQKQLEPVKEVFHNATEGVLWNNFLALVIRTGPGRWRHIRFEQGQGGMEEITPQVFLDHKEMAYHEKTEPFAFPTELDFAPFDKRFPKLKDKRSIGRGVEFLNRYLAKRLFEESDTGSEKMLAYLRNLHYRDQNLMLLDTVDTVKEMNDSLDEAASLLSDLDPQTPWKDFRGNLQRLGIAPGWGHNAGAVLKSIELLQDIIEAPEPRNLEKFLRRLPGVFDIVIMSPHGYFGQAGVLGLPDTGGQVVYILDQVRALEKELISRLEKQGIEAEPRILVITRLIPESGDTGCDVPREKIHGTKNGWIMRIPFRTSQGQVLPQWLSRFQVWPYLEEFAMETEREVLAELQRRPDLVIGNYSDGNYVASLLSDRLQVTQCNIAHALEKTKYLFSALYWEENEENYHFSTQFTADLIAMNRADFLITSTYQEIAGGQDSLGQYESHCHFTMPGLYRVYQGIDVYDPKFNIISPGSDEDCYFPYSETERRQTHLQEQIEELLLKPGLEISRGLWANPEKPVIFSMARMDTIKNLPALVEWYGKNKKLRELTNLLIISGYVDESRSKDAEEVQMIRRMHELIDQYQLDKEIRWVDQQTDKVFNGELYRYIADKKGVFVQPALFEAFGLTVIEAMITGLPVFATLYGGPLEIIQNGKSGFHIDPNHGDETAELLANFFSRCEKEPEYWNRMSQGSIDRVLSRYTWGLYADRLLTLAQVYGFWKYVTNLDREESKSYLDLFHTLMMRKLIQKIPRE